jgi:predicted RNA binding protein YcfA (HicA-like mRNA interferase family)
MRLRELIAAVREHGWEVERVRGSHRIFIKPGHAAVSVPLHGDESTEVPKHVLRYVAKQFGVKLI